jgi:hypothetical protein
MNISKLWLIGPAVMMAVVVGVIGLRLLQPSGDLLPMAEFSVQRITPNADGQDDIAIFRYTLSRNAQVTMVLENEAGQRFNFRENRRRVDGDYSVQFSGIVNGFRLAGESGFRIPGEAADPTLPLLETRLLPNGLYTWTLTAVDDAGEKATRQGQLEIAESSLDLPLISAFDIAPTTFTPNQDGIKDRVSINVYLAKPALLQVYLEDETGARIYLSEREGARPEGDAGNHEFDYDGGVDQGYRPPDDGTYAVYAVAQDAEGQRIIRTGELTIADSGLPQVEIVPQASGGTVCFESAVYDASHFTDATTSGTAIPQPVSICSELTTLTLPIGDLLVFHLTISNYGDAPIRTHGPFPGTVYQFNQRASTLGAYEESGAWRVGIDCETAESDYPWRWAVAAQEDLTAVFDPELNATLYYLEPGQQVETWGAVRLTEKIDSRNPQFCWAGLIHEDVGIPPRQNQVGRREVELVPR